MAQQLPTLPGCQRYLNHQTHPPPCHHKSTTRSNQPPTFLLVVRSKKKGGALLTIPTKPGSFTWCSGTSFGRNNVDVPLGATIDILLDEETIKDSTTRSMTQEHIDLEATRQRNNTKEGAYLYYFLVSDRHLVTRPEAQAFYGAVLLGHRVAPLSEEEIFNAPDDPAMHKVDKGERAVVFAAWLLETFGATQLSSGSGIVDVAAGKGHLSAELLKQYNRAGQSTRQQPQPPTTQAAPLRVTLVEPEQRTGMPASLLDPTVATVFTECFNESFASSHSKLLQHASLLVGLHPDQATEAIVDVALALGVPFAVVPCCVFPKLFPQRRLPSGQRVKSCGGFLRHLRGKHVDIETALLGFEGKNRVLYWRGRNQENQLKCEPCSATFASIETKSNSSQSSHRDLLRTLPTFMKRQIFSFLGYKEYTLTSYTGKHVHALWQKAMDTHRLPLYVPEDCNLYKAVQRIKNNAKLTTIVVGKGTHRVHGYYLLVNASMNIIGKPTVSPKDVVVRGGILVNKNIHGNVHLQNLTIRNVFQNGDGVLGESSFTMKDVVVEDCGRYGVVANGPLTVGKCTNVDIRDCGSSGVVASDGGSVTLIGAKTKVHDNCSKGYRGYGLSVGGSPLSTIQLVCPLTKETVSIGNGGGGNWGAPEGGNGDIAQIKTIVS